MKTWNQKLKFSGITLTLLFMQSLFAQTTTQKVVALKPYKATYAILDGEEVVGTAQRSLEKLDSNWQLQMSTQVKKWFFSYRFTESSTFDLHDSRVRPLSYSSETIRSFKDNRIITSSFDWDKNLESGSKNKATWQLPLQNQLYDHLNYQIGLQIRASGNSRQEKMRVSYKGERETYLFVNEGTELIETPLGKLSAVLYTQQVKDAENKFVMLWLSPEYDYLPIQIAQYNDGQLEGKIKIETINWL